VGQAPALLVLEGDGAHRTEGDDVLLAQLTGRERNLLPMLGRGMTNAEIASACGISDHTVKRHVANILSKLDLANRAAVAAFAARQQPEAFPADLHR
jgi:DNA-binding NarL/FixJ family response regulator